MSAKRSDYIFAISVPLLFIIIALVRLYPFENTLNQIVSDSGNDWSRYAFYALDIKHNGIFIPSLEGAYEKPASFFYCYFLAACFYLFGENNVPVYLLQNLMLGLSVVFTWLAFRNKMSRTISAGFLVMLFLFGLTDVSMYYAFRFLGENLALFLISLFFLLFIRGIEKNNLPALLAAALALGFASLTRPNIFLFVFAFLALLIIYSFKTGKIKTSQLMAFIAIVFIASSFLAFRNYMVNNSIRFLPSQGFAYNIMNEHSIPSSVDLSDVYNSFIYTKLHLNIYYAAYAEYIVQQPVVFFGHYLNKLLFCFGYLKAIVPSYHWFPHWTIMWLGYFTYLFFLFRVNTKTGLWEKATHLFIFCYFSSLILVGQVGNYGFRMLVPGNFFVLPFSFLALEKILALLKNKTH